jgi:hypothetical protein
MLSAADYFPTVSNALPQAEKRRGAFKKLAP